VDPPQPQHRQGGLWNFLTWSFFLSQVMAGEAFFGAQARAAEESGTTHGPAAASGSNAPSGFALDPERVHLADDVKGATLAASGSLMTTGMHSLEGSAAGATSFAADGHAGADPDAASGAGAQAMAASGESQTAEAPGAAGGELVSGGGEVGELVSAALETVDNTIDAVDGVLDQALTSVVAPVTAAVTGVTDQVLQSLDTVTGDVVAGVETLLEPVQDALQPVATVVDAIAAPLSNLLGVQGIVGSAGEIVVAELPLVNALHLDSLFANGAYTSYGLNLDAEPAATQAPASVTSILDGVLGGLEAVVVPHDGQDTSAPPQGLLAGVADELHLRGEGLGLL
jgi:hypothetical protein